METYGPYCNSVEYWRVDSRTPKYSQQDAEVLRAAQGLVLGLQLGGEQLVGGRGVPSDQTLGERPGVVGVPVHGGVLP